MQNRDSCEICNRFNRDMLLLPCCHSCCIDCFLLWSSGAKLEKYSTYYSSIKLSERKLFCPIENCGRFPQPNSERNLSTLLQSSLCTECCEKLKSISSSSSVTKGDNNSSRSTNSSGGHSASGPMDGADERAAKKRKSISSSPITEAEVNADSNSINSNQNINSNAKASSSCSQHTTVEYSTTRKGRKPKQSVGKPSSAPSDLLAQAQVVSLQSPLPAASARVSTVSPMCNKEYPTTEILSSPTKEGLGLGSVSARRLPKKRKTIEEMWMEHFYSWILFKESNGHLEVPPSYETENEDGDVLELGHWLVKQRKDYASNRMPTEQRMTFEQLIGNDGNVFLLSDSIAVDNTATNAAATTTEPCSTTIADEIPTSSLSLEHFILEDENNSFGDFSVADNQCEEVQSSSYFEDDNVELATAHSKKEARAQYNPFELGDLSHHDIPRRSIRNPSDIFAGKMVAVLFNNNSAFAVGKLCAVHGGFYAGNDREVDLQLYRPHAVGALSQETYEDEYYQYIDQVLQCYYYPRDDAQSVVSVAIADVVVTDLQLGNNKLLRSSLVRLRSFFKDWTARHSHTHLQFYLNN